MNDETSPQNGHRHIRFSHDQGQPDQVFSPSFNSPQPSMPPPSNTYSTAPHNPPPTVIVSRDPMSMEDMYGDVGGGYSVPSRPLPAPTHGSGLPERGLDRSGHESSVPTYTNPFDNPSPYPSTAPLRTNNNQLGVTRGRYGSTSEETLVGEQQPPPLKPALRRSSTEEHLRQQAAREASDLVNSHVDGRHRTEKGPVPRKDEDWEDEVGEDWQHQQRAAAGILSNLLRLYGNGQGGPVAGMNRGMTQGSTSSTGSYYNEKDQDLRRRNRRSGEADEGAFPRGGSNKSRMRRADSTNSVNTVGTSAEDKVLDPDDPRSKIGPGMEKWYESEALKLAKEAHDKAAKTGDELGSLDAAEHRDALEGRERKKNKYKKLKHKNSITAHVATLIQKQDFILKLAKALMTFGAPSHRLESQLNATSAVLGVNAQFIHVPSVVIASFGDSDTHTSETKFIKASGGLNLGQLHRIHIIYRDVVHDEMGVEEGIVALDRCLKAKPIYPNWLRVVFAGMCAGLICPLGFAGSIIDALVAGAFGATLCFLQLYVARKNAVFSNIFEISVAALISFAARGLSTTEYFCYESVASAGVVMVLPGYVVLCGSLELASKNLIAGSVRMVYAIIYTLFLGFSIAVGSDVFYLFDPSSRAIAADHGMTVTTLDGTFIANNVTQSFEGSFSFTNATQSIVSQNTASLQKGKVMCYRDPEWQWWRQGASIYWLILLVPAFSFFSSLSNMQPLRSRELPVMIFIAVVGYVANRAATMFIFERSDIVSFIGATVIGLLGNLYSRIFNGTSFTAMASGVLFLVPGGIAAAGGLAMSSGGNDSYNSGLMIGFRMVQVAIGITIGLFFASFLVYSVGTKKRGGGLGFAF